MTTDGAATGQVAALVVYSDHRSTRLSGFSAMAVYVPDQAHAARASQLAALVTYRLDYFNVPRLSALAALVAWAPGIGGESRTRAWTFTLDGHTFYVLDLGAEGTFLYDFTTREWCQFRTAGRVGWNFRVGTTWGATERIAGGDIENGMVWELIPDATLDEGFRDITHFVTGGIMTRSRVYRGVEAVRVAGSIGNLGSQADAAFTMRFSDDGGQTFSDDFVVELVPGEFDGEIAWRSLGSFMSPGRVFEFEDVGGLLRIDGADVYIEDFDGEGQ